MKKTIVILLMLLATVFATCVRIAPADLSKSLCDGYAADGQNINAGCCYNQLGDWGECTLYLLKGARHAEILWDLNRGPFDEGTLAKQYYNPEYYPSSGLGSETGVCLYNYGDSALTAKVQSYYDWIHYYGYGGPDERPFDMDTLIGSLETTLHPPAPTATPKPTIKVPTAMPTAIPTAAPTPEGDNGWVVPVVLLVIAAVVGYLFFTRKGGKSSSPKYPESMDKPAEHKGYIHHVAEKAKEEHEAKHRKMHKKKKK